MPSKQVAIKESVRSTTRPDKDPHEGWAEAVARIAASGKDESLIPDFFEDENFDDWVDGAVQEDKPK